MPWPFTGWRPRYTGAAAHAAAAPEKGRNALDAAVLGYNAVAALRQHIRDDERIHGVFTDGGAKPNIVPATAASEWYVRSTNLTSLQSLKQRVITCLQAGADAACCEVDFVWADPPYADMNDNPALLERYLDNLGTRWAARSRPLRRPVWWAAPTWET